MQDRRTARSLQTTASKLRAQADADRMSAQADELEAKGTKSALKDAAWYRAKAAIAQAQADLPTIHDHLVN